MKGRTEARNVGARIVESRLQALGYTRGEMGMWVKGPSCVEISQWHVTHRRGRETWNEVLSLIGNAHLRGDHARGNKLLNDIKIGETMKEHDLTLETECGELRRALWLEQRKVRALRVAHAIIMNEDRHDPVDGWYARTLFTYDPNNPAMRPVIEYLAAKGE